jgi:hypothetical protein
MSERTPEEISDGFADLKDRAALLFRAKSNLAMAAVTVAIGVLAIQTRFPTKEGSATLAGALFGAAAIFVGLGLLKAPRLRRRGRRSSAGSKPPELFLHRSWLGSLHSRLTSLTD